MLYPTQTFLLFVAASFEVYAATWMPFSCLYGRDVSSEESTTGVKDGSNVCQFPSQVRRSGAYHSHLASVTSIA